MKIGIFWQRQIPHVEDLAEGAEKLGWDVDLRRVRDNCYRGADYDVVVIGGHLERYGGLNGQIFSYFRSRNTPVFVVEMGRMLRPEIPKHAYWFFYLNRAPSAPMVAAGQRAVDRRRMLFKDLDPGPRGEDILVIGQDVHIDARMHATVLPVLRKSTKRKLVWRPRKGLSPDTSKVCHETSMIEDLEEDLRRAHCVVTYTSNVGGDALRLGIPVICNPMASFAPLCSSNVANVDHVLPASEDRVEKYFQSMAMITWSNEEMKSGEPLLWFKDTGQIGEQTTVTVESPKKPHITALTCTGGRQKTFTKLEEYIERQTMRPDLWVITDDCLPATGVTTSSIETNIIEIPKKWKPGEMSYVANFKAAIDYIWRNVTNAEWIAIFEDDDWYSPEYLEFFIPLLAKQYPSGVVLGGEFNNVYYHVGYRYWTRVGKAARNATMASTLFHVDLIPEIFNLLGSYDGLSIDLQMFHGLDPRRWSVYDTDYVIGLKGFPQQRGGGTNSHEARTVARAGWDPDPDLKALRSLIGDDADWYEQFRISSDPVKDARTKFVKEEQARAVGPMEKHETPEEKRRREIAERKAQKHAQKIQPTKKIKGRRGSTVITQMTPTKRDKCHG